MVYTLYTLLYTIENLHTLHTIILNRIKRLGGVSTLLYSIYTEWKISFKIKHLRNSHAYSV